MALHSSEEAIFAEIRKEFENDSEFNKNTAKVTNSSRRRFVLGIIAIVIGVCAVIFSISALDGFAQILGGIIGFGIMVFGGFYGFNSNSTTTVKQDGTLVLTERKSESPFMNRLAEEWEERRKREGLND